MKSLQRKLREELEKVSKQNEEVKNQQEEAADDKDFFHIIILIKKEHIPLFRADKVDLINEGIWKSSDYKNYIYRIDSPHFDYQQKHIHIAHQKHINSKSEQVAWNEDGSRHDKKTFNQNFIGQEKAKKIARNVLGLNDDIVLEKFSGNDVNLILESIVYIPKGQSLLFWKSDKRQTTTC